MGCEWCAEEDDGDVEDGGREGEGEDEAEEGGLGEDLALS